LGIAYGPGKPEIGIPEPPLGGNDFDESPPQPMRWEMSAFDAYPMSYQTRRKQQW